MFHEVYYVSRFLLFPKVDHMGVPNAQLAKEHAKIATVYNNRSAAEQNSIDVALSLLMEDCYRDLRSEICATEAEQRRFRQLVVNNVLATDIMDKDLKMLRNSRWDKAFRGDFVDKNQRDTINRKATIVIEHLMQASDVAHTMQHWHIYVVSTNTLLAVP
jgi:3'5'-cyclic nucleotide phosphodiesterase